MQTTKALTELAVLNAKTDKSRLNIADGKVPGLKLRVSRSGAKSFALMLRDSTGKNTTHTIGNHPETSLKEARRLAEQIRYQVKHQGNRRPEVGQRLSHDRTTLRDLLNEVQPVFAKSRKTWQPRGGEGSLPHARSVIERVFADLLDRKVETITAEELSEAATTYVPLRPLEGKTTANGQVSRALSYLSPVLNWAAGRGDRFKKIGAKRSILLKTPDVRLIQDPAIDDPTITGKRERFLSEDELGAILPLLRYPAPAEVARKKIPRDQDFGPIAVMFMFLTMARKEEVEEALWKHIDFRNAIWRKPAVKSSGAKSRGQDLPLSNAALELLIALKAMCEPDDDDFIFPSSAGGKLGNWGRIWKAILTASGTSGWTRHDIRRTGSTLLEELGVPIQTIDAILDHADPLAKTGASRSAKNYVIVAKRMLRHRPDPRMVALEDLAEAYDVICQHSGDVPGARR